MPAKILVADDNPDDLALLGKAFEDLGAEDMLHAVESGVEALHYLGKLVSPAQLPELIILDVNMPVLNGFDTLALLKENPVYAPIPVIMLSSSADEAFKKKCVDLGAAAFILKPYRYDKTFAERLMNHDGRQK